MTGNAATPLVTATELLRAEWELPTPFEMNVLVKGAPLVLRVVEVLRLLPGKRIAARAIGPQGEYLIKVYFGRHSRRYFRRESRGVRAIAAAGVPTNPVQWQGTTADGGAHVLALEFFRDARSLNDVWERAAGVMAKVMLMRAGAVALARLHAAGVYHADAHLGNFLVAAGRIHVVDGGDVVERTSGDRAGGKPLPESSSLDNLALFLAQFEAHYDEYLSEVVRAYERVRGWEPGDRLRKLTLLIRKRRKRLQRKYLAKTLRNCTAFVRKSGLRHNLICARTEYSQFMEDLLADLSARMADGIKIKEGNSSTVVRVANGSRWLVIKRYNVKHPLQVLTTPFKRGRALRSWLNAHRLRFLGIETLRPLAVLEHRFGPFKGTSYFVSEYVEAPNARRLRQDDVATPRHLRELVALVGRMGSARLSHGDLKADNLLMTTKGPLLIDLDSMRVHRFGWSFARAFNKDLERLLRNWAEVPGIRNQLDPLVENLVKEHGLSA